MDAVHAVRGEVQELIRRSGLDPARDGAAVRALVRDAVADYDERSLPWRYAAAGGPRRGGEGGVDAVAGFGPLQRYLDDPRGRGDLGQRPGQGVRRPATGWPS